MSLRFTEDLDLHPGSGSARREVTGTGWGGGQANSTQKADIRRYAVLTVSRAACTSHLYVMYGRKTVTDSLSCLFPDVSYCRTILHVCLLLQGVYVTALSVVIFALDRLSATVGLPSHISICIG